ncbi:MAG: LysR family transcriptional regulator [Eggerthellaceae bacterium]
MMISLDELLIIKEVVHYGSISYAAQKMHVSTSSLSRTIKQVERDLGAALFWRNGRHLVLNQYGKIMLHYTDVAEKIMSDAVVEIAEMKERQEKLIRIYFHHSLGNTSAVLAPFIRMHPDIQLDIILSNTEAKTKGFDLEFVSTREEGFDPDAVQLANEHYVLAVSPSHRLAHASSVSITDLQNEAFVVPPAEHGGALLDEVCRVGGFRPSKKIDCPQVWGALHYVEQGIGVLVAPELSMLAGLESQVVKIPLEGVTAGSLLGTRHLQIIWSPNYEPTPAAWALVHFLQQYFKEAPSVFKHVS